MASPSIAHYGTTIIESPPPEGVDQKSIPATGALAGTLRLLEILGFEPLLENMYPGMGRQYIRRRGQPGDSDYVEFDAFTSYSAVERPQTPCPRIGDTLFRITHHNPVDVFRRARAEGLVHPLVSDAVESFESGRNDWVLFRGPNGQGIELGPTQTARADNHVIYVWTDPASLDATARDYEAHFGVLPAAAGSFHGLAHCTMLRRERPGISIGLLTPNTGEHVAPRWTDDIFLEAGYSHFRLGAPDKQRALAASRQAFPDGGDVSFVYFRDSYLELVQVQADDPALA
ncbi:MAG: hypothetical protein H6994_04730 [Pseudomonadales bacterium]|nr:hypothetical protein [Pseudomonadales bacterium]